MEQLILGDFFQEVKNVQDNSVDLVICDGPYNCTDHEWDNVTDIQQFNLNLIKIFAQKLKPGGSCYLFGKHYALDFIDYRPYLQLSTKIIWYQPSRLSQGRKKYTNNYDIIGYFNKGEAKTFNLDAIRVPQMVELEHRKRCENVPSVKNGKFGNTKFNDLGKNPGDVFGDIKQLTYKSKELVSRDALNTIQKPLALMERLVKASSNENDVVLVPFAGVGTECVAAKMLKRQFIGIEKNESYYKICLERLVKY